MPGPWVDAAPTSSAEARRRANRAALWTLLSGLATVGLVWSVFLLPGDVPVPYEFPVAGMGMTAFLASLTFVYRESYQRLKDAGR